MMIVVVGLVLVFNEKIAKFSRLRKDDIKLEGNNRLRVNSSSIEHTDCYGDFKKQNRGRERVRYRNYNAFQCTNTNFRNNDVNLFFQKKTIRTLH